MTEDAVRTREGLGLQCREVRRETGLTDGTPAPEDLHGGPKEIAHPAPGDRIHDGALQRAAGQQDTLARLPRNPQERSVLVVRREQGAFEGFGFHTELVEQRHDQGQDRRRVRRVRNVRVLTLDAPLFVGRVDRQSEPGMVVRSVQRSPSESL